MDAFFEHHRKSIRFRYRCFDRILLNALIQPFQQPRAPGRFLWQLPQAISGKPGYPARDRGALPELGEESGTEVGRSDRGGSPRPAR